MQKLAFRMQLHPGQAEEYRRRHDAIWPDLAAALKDAGISDYSIHLDRETERPLRRALAQRRPRRWTTCPSLPVMRRWWAHMADIMATNPDGSPVVTPSRRSSTCGKIDLLGGCEFPTASVFPRRRTGSSVG